jgi:hypothetical protein
MIELGIVQLQVQDQSAGEINNNNGICIGVLQLFQLRLFCIARFTGA